METKTKLLYILLVCGALVVSLSGVGRVSWFECK